jgi:hypothetical protein
MPAPADKPDAVRLRHGLVLLAGAVALELLVGIGPLAFHWTPFIVGSTYLAVAAAGGPAHGHWATAIVLVTFGASVLLVDAAGSGADHAAAYLLGAGLGGMAAALLAPLGFAVDALGVATAVTFAGLFLLLADEYPSALARAEPYAILLAAVGIVNVVLAARSRTAAAS